MKKIQKKILYLKTAKKYFEKICEWKEKGKKNDAISFIQKIFSNIHNNPNILKFRNLNISKIKKLTKKWDSVPMMILLNAGFMEDIFNQRKMSLDQQNMIQFDKVTRLFFKIFNFQYEEHEKDETKSIYSNLEKETIKIYQPIYLSKNVSKNFVKVEKKKDISKKKKEVVKILNLKSMLDREVDVLNITKERTNYVSKLNIKKIADLNDIEKIKQLTQKREKFRTEKQRKKFQKEAEEIKKNREATKAKTQLKERWEEYQTKLLIKHKKNEKILNVKRKAKAREKIEKQKEQRKMKEVI